MTTKRRKRQAKASTKANQLLPGDAISTHMVEQYGTPWRLCFDRDGTEDYGIIRDKNGNQIAASHICGRDEWDKGTFWLPEQAGDTVPVTVRQMQMMSAAPKLYAALEAAEAMLGDYRFLATIIGIVGRNKRDTLPAKIEQVRSRAEDALSDARGEIPF